jgi:hypothetical protein
MPLPQRDDTQRMIIRVLSVEVAPDRGPEFHAFIRDRGLPRIQSHPGLLSVHVGRRTEGRDERAVVVTVWNDWQALTEALGPDPSAPYMLTPETGLVTRATVEHFEAIDLPPSPTRETAETETDVPLAPAATF